MNLHIGMTQEGTVRYPLHRHGFCEIMLYFDGVGYLKTENGNIPFERGTAIVVPSGIMHGSVSENGFCNISVGGDFYGMFLFDSPASIVTNEDSMTLCRLIYDNRFSDSAYLNSLVCSYITSLMRAYRISSPVDRAVEKLTSVISENALNYDFDIVCALASVGYAEDYIRAKFRQRTGKTPTEFLCGIRIEHACKLIDIYGDAITVTELAGRCGYPNPAYFSRVFRNITGVSPKKYREKTRRQ